MSMGYLSCRFHAHRTNRRTFWNDEDPPVFRGGRREYRRGFDREALHAYGLLARASGYPRRCSGSKTCLRNVARVHPHGSHSWRLPFVEQESSKKLESWSLLGAFGVAGDGSFAQLWFGVAALSDGDSVIKLRPGSSACRRPSLCARPPKSVATPARLTGSSADCGGPGKPGA